MSISRKHFLKQAGAFALGFSGLKLFTGCTSMDAGTAGSAYSPYGPLMADPNGLFDLPEGFSYHVFSRFGTKMDDGLLIPHRHDGMAAFPGPDGHTILIRNHEVNPATGGSESAFGPGFELLDLVDRDKFYDYGMDANPGQGGTTTVIYDTENRRVVREFLSLAGTLRNCAGGPTPWNSWLSCEEIVMHPDGTYAESHGYVFEVPATPEIGLADPVPIKAMGRFNHEAVAVDPGSGVVYLTEDRGDGLLYRYIPDTPGQLHDGGRLQALVCREQPGLDTRNWTEKTIETGDTFECEWIDLEDIDAPDDDLRLRGHEDGAARFARGEGMWYGNEGIYFACTNGGEEKLGQIWKYTPGEFEGTAREPESPGSLELFAESEKATHLENADNLTVAPWGDIIVCEDGGGEDFLIGITPEGEYYRLGRNVRNDSELAGATFSPDGSALFVNIQSSGITLAITGPWQQTEGGRQ